jgi:PhnB protein
MVNYKKLKKNCKNRCTQNNIIMKKTTTRIKKVKSVPEGFHTVTPYLVVDGANELIDFIKNGFGGEEKYRMNTDNNRISHATMKVGDSMLMISDTMSNLQPQLSMLFLYVDDVDSTYQKAIDAHGESIQEPHDEFYGDRVSIVRDRWGNEWWIATHKENVEGEELERRAKEAHKQREVVSAE